MTARVLVVDDLVPNIKLLEAKLTSEYFEVVTATDGATALKLIEDQLPDIVLLDVMMPEMNGFEVCRRIKQNPHSMHVPVVMVTALSDAADRVRGLECGADDFLTKPINDTALFARVRSLVRLKMLMDEWRLREQTSGQFGMLSAEHSIWAEDATGARILIVEDNAVEIFKLEETLAPLAREVVHAPTIAEAYERALQVDFDLVIINLNLRGQDGLRLCSQIRSSEKTRQSPILIIVEEDDTGRLAKALDLGVNDYLIKPLDRNELLARTKTQIRRRRYQDRLRDTYERNLQMALTDSLTGLYNRRYLEAHVGGLLDRISTSGKLLSLMIFDIDFFKKVNDTHGHQVGDDVLREIAHRVTHNVRSFDTVARLGGEEFVVVMPDTDLTVASVVAERLRNDVAAEPFRASGVPDGLTITISIGVASSLSGDTTEALLKRADDAMYEAKRTGRNKVILWTSDGLCEVQADLIGNLASLGD